MYWLHTTNEDYLDCTYWRYHFLPDAMIEYHRLIKDMMEKLPEKRWFNLKIMRVSEEGNFMPDINRDQVVRSWVIN